MISFVMNTAPVDRESQMKLMQEWPALLEDMERTNSSAL
jgi:hypothetical protein